MKPQSTWLISVHAEGATKVLSIIDSSYHILNDIESEYIPQMKEMREHDRKLDNFIHYEERISVSIPSIGISVMSSYPQELLFASVNNTIIELAQSLDRQKFSLQISTLQIDNQLQDTPYPVILYFDHENRRSPVGSKDEEIKIGSDNVVQSPKNRPIKHVLSLAAAKWRNSDIPLVSFEYITLRVADFHLQLEEEMILSLFELYKVITKRLQSRIFPHADSTLPPLFSDFGIMKETSTRSNSYDPYKANRFHVHSSYDFKDHKGNPLKPSVVPVGAPGQKIYLLARKQNKIYVELFDVAPMKLTFSFSSSPWILRNGVLTLGESLIHRGLVALADVEGAQIHFKRLIITHQLSSWESLEEILVRHYTRQLLHEIYKVFGSAGVIGNPVGFARRMGLGIKEFLSVPARSVLQSPAGLITGMAEGTSSLVNNTVYAISDAATQFSRAAHKGIVAFTFDDQAVAMEKQQKGISSHSKGVINELLEGLTGLLQSPIKGAEKHGLPGVLSGIALGVTGLVARPAASILEVTGKTAQSIRNRSKLHHSGSWCLRVRLPRPLSRGFPLVPYSWEEAVGMSVLGGEADEGLKLKDEILVMCKALKEGGKFAVMTERLVLVVSCSSLVDLGKPEFKGIPSDPQWVVEEVIRMVSIIDAEAEEEVVHIVAGTADAFHKICGGGMRGNKPPPLLPIYQTSLEFKCKQVADELLHVLLSAIEKGKQTGWGSPHLIHRGKLKL